VIGEVREFLSLRARRGWDRSRIDELRRVKLRRLIRHAYDNVPYYRRLMDHARVRPDEIRGPEDLQNIPVTTKKDLRNAGPDCLAHGAGPLITLQTSGHSGIPFEVKMTAAEYRTRRLREFRMLIGLGVRPTDRLVLLGPVRTRPARLHRRLGFYRMEVIPLTLPEDEQLARFRSSNPDILWAYPTILKTALYNAHCGLSDLVRPRFLITSGQVMEPVFRERLRRELPSMEIVNIYGSAEVGRIGAECRHRRGLHLEEDALIVEFLQDGNRVEPGTEGHVAVTSLDQLTMPFIRYEQGDLCRLRAHACECCWRTPLIDPPLGRSADMITLPCGGALSPLPLDVALRNELSLWQYRFIQHRPDHIEAQLCFRELPSPDKVGELKRLMENTVGHGIVFDVQLIPEMRFEGSKFKVFLSNLSPTA